MRRFMEVSRTLRFGMSCVIQKNIIRKWIFSTSAARPNIHPHQHQIKEAFQAKRLYLPRYTYLRLD